MKSTTMAGAAWLLGCGAAACAMTGSAAAQTIQLGNIYAASDSSSQSVTFTAPAGGPYLGFMIRTLWTSDGGATPSSDFARMHLLLIGEGVIYPTTATAQGSTYTTESRVITWFGNLPSVAGGTSMTLFASQLSPTGLDSFARWLDTTITFIPSPGSVAPLALAGLFTSRRRRARRATP